MRSRRVVDWTPRQVEILRKGRAAGLSYGRIAALIGPHCTRNAALAKGNRLGLDAVWAKQHSEACPSPPVEPPPVKPKPPEPAGRPGQRCVTPGCRNLSVGWHGRCSVCNADELAMRRREGAA